MLDHRPLPMCAPEPPEIATIDALDVLDDGGHAISKVLVE
jgi:hypothetical protein